MTQPDENKDWKRYVPRFIRKDFIRKLIAFLLTLLIVFLVNYRQTDSANIKIANVRYVIANEQYVFASADSADETPEVTLSVSSSKRQLASLKGDDFSLEIPIDAESAEKGEIDLNKLDVRRVVSPDGVTVKSFVTQKLKLPPLEKNERKRVPLEAVYDSSELSPDYRIADIQFFSPETARPVTGVEVTGVTRALSRVRSVTTRAIPLRGMTDSFEYTVPVSAFPRNDDVVSSLASVIVKVSIVRDVHVETIHKVPVMALANPPLIRNFIVTPIDAAVEVSVRGLRKNVDAFMEAYAKSPEILFTFVDISNLKKGDGSETPRLIDVRCMTSFPDVTLSVTPSKVNFKIH